MWHRLLAVDSIALLAISNSVFEARREEAGAERCREAKANGNARNVIGNDQGVWINRIRDNNTYKFAVKLEPALVAWSKRAGASVAAGPWNT